MIFFLGRKPGETSVYVQRPCCLGNILSLLWLTWLTASSTMSLSTRRISQAGSPSGIFAAQAQYENQMFSRRQPCRELLGRRMTVKIWAFQRIKVISVYIIAFTWLKFWSPDFKQVDKIKNLLTTSDRNITSPFGEEHRCTYKRPKKKLEKKKM